MELVELINAVVLRPAQSIVELVMKKILTPEVVIGNDNVVVSIFREPAEAVEAVVEPPLFVIIVSIKLIEPAEEEANIAIPVVIISPSHAVIFICELELEHV